MDLLVTIIHPKTTHSHTVVFLHGRGDTAAHFAESLQESLDSKQRTITEIFPSLRWVFPSAQPRDCVAHPGDRLSQWFDVWNSKDLSDRPEVQIKGLRESVDSISTLLEAEAATLQGRWDKILLAGISQGGSTCVHTLLNLDFQPSDDASMGSSRRLGGLLGVAARMPFAGKDLSETRAILRPHDTSPDSEIIRNTPVHLQICADDPLVSVTTAQTLRDTLQGFGAHVIWREYRDGGHWFNAPRGIDDAASFIQEVLAISETV